MKYKIQDRQDFKNYFHDRDLYNEGVETINVSSWEDFNGILNIFNNNIDYIWRGQRFYYEDSENTKKWKLLSTYYRDYKGKIRLKDIFDNFKKKLKDLPFEINFSKDNEIWAIGQHYGLPTPLLDWTKNPYIAAFFAFYKKDKNQTRDRVVYALNRVVKRLMIKEKDPKTKEVLKKQRNIEFDFDTENFTPEHHQRFLEQEGAFTRAYRGEDIKSVVKKFWIKDHENKKNYTTKVILAEILIPNECYKDFLRLLKSMNITYGKLFPDFSGAVDICKTDLDLDKLKIKSSS